MNLVVEMQAFAASGIGSLPRKREGNAVEFAERCALQGGGVFA